MGTPELGLNRTSQGDMELIRAAWGQCREESCRLDTELLETRTGAHVGRLEGLVCVYTCVLVCLCA